jgi:osmoprotectant transport system ATP-binding protein
LHKTVVFVTHDIDEALKLGDKVVVFGPGGSLQQYDKPARLLSNPANEFVAGFIGADRGYRGLQFRHATGLPLHEIRAVSEAEINDLTLGPDGWALVNKPDGTPYAWINARGVALHRDGSSLYDSTIAGGSLFRPDDSLRQALDAALSSPSGLGVAVDGDGRAVGGILADDVLSALKTQRQA